MIDKLHRLQKHGAGNFTINTLLHYHNIFLKYQHYAKHEKSKMQCYTNVCEDIGCSEDTVMRAVKLFCSILQNNK